MKVDIYALLSCSLSGLTMVSEQMFFCHCTLFSNFNASFWIECTLYLNKILNSTISC